MHFQGSEFIMMTEKSSDDDHHLANSKSKSHTNFIKEESSIFLSFVFK